MNTQLLGIQLQGMIIVLIINS